MTKLRLSAQDAADIAIISAALQDAILRVGDIVYQPRQHALTLRLSRYAHEQNKKRLRVLTGLRIDGVLSMRSREIRRDDPDAMMVLLDMAFIPSDEPPGGQLTLVFAGGGEIVLDIEAPDMMLIDIGQTRETQSRPLHPEG